MVLIQDEITNVVLAVRYRRRLMDLPLGFARYEYEAQSSPWREMDSQAIQCRSRQC